MLVVYTGNMMVNVLPALNNFYFTEVSFKRVCARTPVAELSQKQDVNAFSVMVISQEKKSPSKWVIKFCSSKDFHNIAYMQGLTSQSVVPGIHYFYSASPIKAAARILSPPPRV